MQGAMIRGLFQIFAVFGVFIIATALAVCLVMPLDWLGVPGWLQHIIGLLLIIPCLGLLGKVRWINRLIS
jgi:hypothetical protein